ncbi:PadR family transcriptional regulator [uncultured Vagococcus sp.]|uniref:PadR family transcriptional regulator n=1 Tax=uncultured Vagococcus sp. TaxID=189676 RepID=UPI0028D8CFB1|nr:PadR family transcriptional regulator [uncultured Vagococcus sp.]
MSEKDIIQSYLTELRRGSLVLAVLGCLSKPFYGYGLLQELQDKDIPIEANTLYPLLRRLEKQGLLTSDWDTTESRPRKYYLINDTGKQVTEALRNEWLVMQRSISTIFEED